MFRDTSDGSDAVARNHRPFGRQTNAICLEPWDCRYTNIAALLWSMPDCLLDWHRMICLPTAYCPKIRMLHHAHTYMSHVPGLQSWSLRCALTCFVYIRQLRQQLRLSCSSFASHVVKMPQQTHCDTAAKQLLDLLHSCNRPPVNILEHRWATEASQTHPCFKVPLTSKF